MLFAQAARDHKLILVNVEDPLSHSCHRMDESTYANPDVIALLSASYIPVAVDAAEHPEIADLYHGANLPITVIFNAAGGEILHKEGWQRPLRMASLLQAVIDDPSPLASALGGKEPVYSASPLAAPALLDSLRKQLPAAYEIGDDLSSFGARLLDPDFVDEALLLADRGDVGLELHLRETIRQARALIDPAWGGAWQSLIIRSTSGSGAARFCRIQIGGYLDASGDAWNEPHYEKPLLTQAQALVIFTRAYSRWHDPRDLDAARSILRYVRAFLLAPDGSFHAGQDADPPALAEDADATEYFALDDLHRRTLGLPPVSPRIDTRDNGAMICALCDYYTVTGHSGSLAEAEADAEWLMAHRSRPDGGFSHDDGEGGPYLCDDIAAGRAFFALYQSTGDDRWLSRATAAADAAAATFTYGAGPGFRASVTPLTPAYHPLPDREENVEFARFAEHLFATTGNGRYDQIATRAMRYLATPEVASADFPAPALLAAEEFATAHKRPLNSAAR